MDKLFLSVLNMSLTASFVIAGIILARLFLKKAPKTISYALWAVAGFRLVFPFSLESMFSLIPFKAAPIPADIAIQPIPRVDSGIHIVDNAVSRVLPTGAPAASVNPLQVWLTFGAYLWLAGIAVMLIYSIVSVVLLNRRLRGAVHFEDNIYEAGNLKTPFVLGLFRPKIYLPAGLSDEEKRYIILHERTHIRRHDHLVKFLAYFILCLHWFNPLAWAAFLLMGADMEMSCDERVLKELGDDTKKAYSMSLLSLATERRIIGGSPLAFGEGGMKERIKNVLNFKKPSRVIITAAVALAAILSIGFAMNRIDAANPSNWEIYHFPSYLYDRVTFNTDAMTYSPSFEAVTAKLTNRDMESGLMCGKAFTLVKQVGKDWRIVPFTEGMAFDDIAISLPIGNSETYTLTPEMLSDKLDAGNYRIVTDVWYANETPPYTIRHVWAGFVISENEADISNQLTLDDVQKLAQKGNALTFEDFKDFKGVDASSTTNYYIMVYGIEGGYRLIVRTDGKQIDSADLESIWESGGSGIDIRYGDVDEFTKNHPSSEATEVEPTSPELSLEQSVSVDMAELDYASDDIVIFHDYFGLFVYDLESLQIIRSLDLKPLNCHQTQGDNYCEVSVSTDGNTVQLHPVSSKNMYVYTVSNNTLRETAYEKMDDRFSSFVPMEDVIGSENIGKYSHHAVKFDTGGFGLPNPRGGNETPPIQYSSEYGFLHASDLTIKTLSYVRGDMIYRLFGFDTPPASDESWELIGDADLNRDGLKDMIYLDKSNMDSGSWVTLRVFNNSGKEIWSADAAISHAGWNSLFLCMLDGKYYLLRYNPYMGQGHCAYTYTLFTLEGRAEHPVRSNTIEFDIIGVNQLDAPKMVAFAEEVNALLGKSSLLLSSEGGEFSFGPASADPFFEKYSWLDDTPELYKTGDSLESRLNKYSEFATFNFSDEGRAFQTTAYEFANAFFEKNSDVMKSFLIAPDKDYYEYDLDYGFDDIKYMRLKFNPDDAKKGAVSAQYEFRLDGEDSYTYLQLNMKKVNADWKVEFYGLEK